MPLFSHTHPTQQAPTSVKVNTADAPFTYDAATQSLTITPAGLYVTSAIDIEWS